MTTQPPPAGAPSMPPPATPSTAPPTSARVPPSSTPPPPTGPPHPPAPGFVRRVAPFALLGGTGFFLYKAGTDPDFRASVENAFPPAARLLELLPSPSPPPFVTDNINKTAAAQMESKNENGATLPPNYSSVPDLLMKIEKANTTNATDDHVQTPEPVHPSGSHSTIGKKVADSVNTDKRVDSSSSHGTKSQNPVPGDGPIRLSDPGQSGTKQMLASEDREVGLADVLGTSEGYLKHRGEASGSGSDDASAGDGPHGNIAIGRSVATPAAKNKVARIFGKGDFHPEQVKGSDVVNTSEYKKPNKAGRTSSSTMVTTSEPREVQASPVRHPGKLPDTSTAAMSGSASFDEVKALRAELESQTKWEAVRLQEAVRSQMVEDAKKSAKELAEVRYKHVEELARVRQDALTDASKVITQRVAEAREAAENQRDAEVSKLVSAKEAEVREALKLELTEKKRIESSIRERALAEAKSQVAALTSEFDGLVSQAERAKEAAKRASSAFLLRETMAVCEPLRHELSVASGESELGQLVKSSVPDCAMHDGVSSVEGLENDFKRAAKRGLSVAMVPEGKAGTLWGHFLGAIFSRLKIAVDDRMEGDKRPGCSEDRIRLAQHLVKEGDLAGAVRTLESLDGLAASVMFDWISEAKARIAADLAAEVLLADAIISQVGLTRKDKIDAISA